MMEKMKTYKVTFSTDFVGHDVDDSGIRPIENAYIGHIAYPQEEKDDLNIKILHLRNQ